MAETTPRAAPMAKIPLRFADSMEGRWACRYGDDADVLDLLADAAVAGHQVAAEDVGEGHQRSEEVDDARKVDADHRGGAGLGEREAQHHAHDREDDPDRDDHRDVDAGGDIASLLKVTVRHPLPPLARLTDDATRRALSAPGGRQPHDGVRHERRRQQREDEPHPSAQPAPPAPVRVSRLAAASPRRRGPRRLPAGWRRRPPPAAARSVPKASVPPQPRQGWPVCRRNEHTSRRGRPPSTPAPAARPAASPAQPERARAHREDEGGDARARRRRRASPRPPP